MSVFVFEHCCIIQFSQSHAANEYRDLRQWYLPVIVESQCRGHLSYKWYYKKLCSGWGSVGEKQMAWNEKCKSDLKTKFKKKEWKQGKGHWGILCCIFCMCWSIKHLQATLMMLITSLIFWCFWKHQSEGPRRLQFIKIPDKKNFFFCFGLIGMDILLLLISCFQGLWGKEGGDRRKKAGVLK